MGRSIATHRRIQAVELALAGHSFDDIAQRIGYSNRGTAWRAVQKALRDREVEAVDVYRETELARLDALQEACWEPACAGDRASIETALRIIEKRCRLLGIWDCQTFETESPKLVQDCR